MDTATRWLAELDAELIELVYKLLAHDNPDEEQLAELPELPSWSMAASGIAGDDEARLAAAIDDLGARLQAADPRHRFIKANGDVELAPRLRAFYDSNEVERFQHHALVDTAYAPYPLHVDFDLIFMLENPDFTDETIGESFVEWANLIADLDGDPDGTECYAHLAIDPTTTTIYLMEPSGDPELVAENLDAFLGRLVAR